MEKDKAPSPRLLASANDNPCPPIPSAKIDVALRRIARLIGRQMAREAFEVQAVKDNDR